MTDPTLSLTAEHGVSVSDVRYYRQFYRSTKLAAMAAARSQAEFGPLIDWEEPRCPPRALRWERAGALACAGAALLLIALWRYV